MAQGTGFGSGQGTEQGTEQGTGQVATGNGPADGPADGPPRASSGGALSGVGSFGRIPDWSSASLAEALTHLRAAHAAVDDAARAVRLAHPLEWDSPAANRFRAVVGDVLGAIEGDLQLLGLVVRSTLLAERLDDASRGAAAAAGG